jgi:hypothetical protein
MVKATTSKKRESVWTKGQPKEKLIRELPQVPNTKSIPRDAARKARLPGLRLSKNGNKYCESRSNRSDKRGTSL